jgi:hypothetical protein
LDVGSGHSTHTVANTFVLKKLQLFRVPARKMVAGRGKGSNME